MADDPANALVDSLHAQVLKILPARCLCSLLAKCPTCSQLLMTLGLMLCIPFKKTVCSDHLGA